MKIAVASSDGVNVDLHLGKANLWYIYDFDGKDTVFIEKRTVDIDENSRHQGSKVLNSFKDCDVLICAQYGFNSKMKAEDLNLKLFGVEGEITKVLKKFVDHYNFMKKPLF
jgi:predicted Fe-Mo cluster-binding NifX family protein